MSNAIWKYKLNTTHSPVVKMKTGARPFHVAMQNETLYVWAVVNVLAEEQSFEFQIRGTGHLMTGSEGVYIGTVHDPIGFVWHVFSSVKEGKDD